MPAGVCDAGKRQIHDYLFKGYREWVKKINAFGRRLGEKIDMGNRANVFESRNGFGFSTEGKFKVTATGDLLGAGDRFTVAAPGFLMEPKLVKLRSPWE